LPGSGRPVPIRGVMFAPTTKEIAAHIVCLSGRPVLLQQDLARIYGVTVSRLRDLVQQHADFFPGEFCFTPELEELYREGRAAGSCGAFTLPGALIAGALIKSPAVLARSVQVAGAFEARQREDASGTLFRTSTIPRQETHNIYARSKHAPLHSRAANWDCRSVTSYA
jgi:hypothetical protein